MRIHPLPAFIDNYIWLLIQDSCSVFDCVDPGQAEPVLDFAHANSLQLRSILLTHHHADHIGGVQDLLNAFPKCLVYAPDDVRIPNAHHRLHLGDTLLITPFMFQILSTPGHTATHISYFEPNEQWLFCGDTLFSAGCGRVFDGTIEALHDSIALFKSLPKTTKVFCAHEYTLNNLRFAATVEPNNQAIQDYMQHLIKPCSLPSTIEKECLVNPFFRTHQAQVVAYALHHGATSTGSLEVFGVLRDMKNAFQ
jgi:hydroxyacylglutathione hydrolase